MHEKLPMTGYPRFEAGQDRAPRRGLGLPALLILLGMLLAYSGGLVRDRSVEPPAPAPISAESGSAPGAAFAQ